MTGVGRSRRRSGSEMDSRAGRASPTRRQGGIWPPCRRHRRPVPRGRARILRDQDLAEDATQQALLAIWQNLPRLRDPGRFEAWSYRLLVHACYAEGRKERRWMPNLRLLPVEEAVASDDLTRSSIASNSSAASAACRSTIARCWSCTTTSICRSTEIAEILEIPSGRRTPVSTMRCAGCALRSRPTSGRRRGRLAE